MNKRQRKKHVRKFFKRNLSNAFLETIPESKPKVVIEENNELFLRLVSPESTKQIVENIEKNTIRYKGGREQVLQVISDLKQAYGEEVFNTVFVSDENHQLPDKITHTK